MRVSKEGDGRGGTYTDKAGGKAHVCPHAVECVFRVLPVHTENYKIYEEEVMFFFSHVPWVSSKCWYCPGCTPRQNIRSKGGGDTEVESRRDEKERIHNN